MLDLLLTIVGQTLWVLYEGALFILAGFAIAGAVHLFVEPDRIVRYLGGRNFSSAAVAAILGAPLPLCSCGVLPTAVSLRRKGASPESTLSFLITTPETGIDSVSLTVAFFGPSFAIVRVLAAIATGLVAAALSLRHWREGQEPPPESSITESDADPHRHSSNNSKAANAGSKHRRSDGSSGHRLAAWFRLWRLEGRRAVRYAFVELFDELGFWLALAIVLTGVLSAILPADFFTRVFPSSFAAMVAMVMLGMPALRLRERFDAARRPVRDEGGVRRSGPRVPPRRAGDERRHHRDRRSPVRSPVPAHLPRRDHRRSDRGGTLPRLGCAGLGGWRADRRADREPRCTS